MGVSVRQKNGKWFVFIRHAGDRVAQKCVDRENAEDAQKAITTAIAAGQFDMSLIKAAKAKASAAAPAAPAVTLKQFFDKTVSPLWQASLGASTFDRYETCFRIHIVPAIGETAVEELTRETVKGFVVSLLQKDARKRAHSEKDQAKEKARKLSKDSVRNVIAALRAALTEAVEKGMIPANPAVRLGKLYREAEQVREEVDPFTAEEIPLLLEAARHHFGFENYVVMLTAFHTGMRAGEIAGLHWSDVDTRGRFISVRRQLKDGERAKTKQRKLRKVDISDALLVELQALKRLRREECLARGKNEIPDSVFLSAGARLKDGEHAEGCPLQMDNWRNRVFWKACDKAGVRRRRLHDTRHTFASILLMNSESPAYVRDQLGHSSIKMTVDVYGHFIPGANRQAVNRLPSIAPPATAAKSAAGA